MSISRPNHAVALVALAFAFTSFARGQTALPEFVVTGQRVANQTSVGTIDMPVSALRFEPRVDVQSRNLAEAQADVAIRGGLFESSGMRVGAAAVVDPQTGHYLTELPVAPAMLEAPRVETGVDNAARGFGASAGTVAYGLRRISSGGVVCGAAGEDGFNRQSLYAARMVRRAKATIGGDLEWARSESDGSLPGGDHDFQRVVGRAQLVSSAGQTDVLVGYQHKFFGWPNLYTPFGFNESENLQTLLALANHQWSDGAGNSLSAAAFFRRNKDDYEFNRALPGASNPFQHTTWVRGVSVASRRVISAEWALESSAQFSHDRLESTSLTFGRYLSRAQFKATALPRYSWGSGSSRGTVRAGATLDDSNRTSTVVSPLASVEWRSGDQTVYAEYSEATQLPSYTALNSNSAAGLFRGNANLGRSTARNLEVGLRRALGGWQVEAAVFRRADDALVDWTFRSGVVARTANPVDLRTTGVELLAARRAERWDLVLSYAWLERSSSYGSATIDASFYALNFPRQRATAALTARLGGGWEVRFDNEYRVQEPNVLRTAGGAHALLAAAGVYFQPRAMPGWEFSFLVDNLWDDDFQEVPAVPAGRRQWALGATWRW